LKLPLRVGGSEKHIRPPNLGDVDSELILKPIFISCPMEAEKLRQFRIYNLSGGD